jgi:hypothetical protein
MITRSVLQFESVKREGAYEIEKEPSLYVIIKNILVLKNQSILVIIIGTEELH